MNGFLPVDVKQIGPKTALRKLFKSCKDLLYMLLLLERLAGWLAGWDR
jgi:hypothetical protein